MRTIPEPTLRRLPWYLSFVQLLKTEGHEYVSSTRIALGVGVDAALVAKDLSYVQLQGRTRVGYETAALIEYLEEFLGFTKQHRAFLIGVGSLGSGLLADKGLRQFGLEVLAGFDVAEEIIGTEVAGVPVYHIDELASRIQAEEVQIAILTVPVLQAQLMTDRLVRAGIRALWNFTPFRIQTPPNVVVLLQLSYTPRRGSEPRPRCTESASCRAGILPQGRFASPSQYSFLPPRYGFVGGV